MLVCKESKERPMRRGGRVVDGARLERVFRLIA